MRSSKLQSNITRFDAIGVFLSSESSQGESAEENEIQSSQIKMDDVNSYSKQDNNSNHATEEKDISSFIDDWFDRTGNPRNYIFTCKVPKCTYSGAKRSRAIDHASQHPVLTQIVSELIACEKSNKLFTIENLNQDDLSPSKKMNAREVVENSNTKRSMEDKAMPTDSNTLALRFLLKKNLPLSYVSDPAFLEYSNGLLVLGKYGVSEIQDTLYGTTSFAEEFLPKFVEKNQEEYEVSINKYKMYGWSLISDSRTDIARESIFVIGLQSHGCYRMMKVIYGDTSKKDTNYYFAILSEEVKAKQYIYSLCNDSASVCIAAALRLEQEYSLIFIRCQCHALNNIVKHIFQLGYFRELLENCCTLLHFYRAYHAISKDSKDAIGMQLIQFSPTRFGGIFFMFHRIYSLQEKLVAHLCGDSLKKITASGNEELEARRKKCFGILMNQEFKTTLEFAVALSSQMIRYLFIIDHGNVSAGYIWPMWSSIADSLAATLGKYDNISFATRVNISRTFYSDWHKYCSPALCAAAMLNPDLYDTFHKMRLDSGNVETRQTLSELKKYTLDTLKKLSQRVLNDNGKANNAYACMEQELNKYLNGDYDKMRNDESIFQYWERKCDLMLGYYAPIVLSMGVSNSNVERNHKVFSFIRNKQRNRMSNDMLTTLVKGHLIVTTDTKKPATVHKIDADDILCWKDEDELENYNKWFESVKIHDENERQVKSTNNKRASNKPSLSSIIQSQSTAFEHDPEQPIIEFPNDEKKQITEWLNQMDQDWHDATDYCNNDTSIVSTVSPNDSEGQSTCKSACKEDKTKCISALQTKTAFHMTPQAATFIASSSQSIT